MAASAGNGPVVLLGAAEDEPLTGRIAAELRALGIPIELRVVAGEEPGIDLEVESALRDGARAAVRIDSQAGRTEVSIADPSSHRVALRQVLEGPPTAAMVPVLALRTVEFVRATLLGAPRGQGGQEGRSREESMSDAAAGDAGIATSLSGKSGPVQPMSRLRLALNSGAIFTPGGASTQFTFGITARFRLMPRVGLEVMSFAPLSQGHVVSDGLTTKGSSWIAGGGVFWRQPTSERTAIELGAGGFAAFLQSTGNVGQRTDLTNGASDGWATAGYARVGGELALARNLALRLDLLGGVVFKRVLFSETDTTMPPVTPIWDHTFAAALGGVEARWF
jgi:hypothetical protein